MTSEKLTNCYHEHQQLVGRTRFLSFGFRYENDVRSWMFEQRRVWRQPFFRWTYPMTHNAPSHHLLFFWSYSLYKSFSLWKQHNAILIMKIILLLLGNKWGDSEQHECFSLVLFITHTIQSSNKHTTVYYCDGTIWIRHAFLLAYIIYI